MKGSTALCSAIALPDAAEAPEWLHLLPAGEAHTVDGRGPFRVADPAALIAASLQAAGGKLPLCENHATDLAGPKGGAAPARGWIVELQDRGAGAEGGIWGRVDWTDAGRRMVAAKEYRGVSPVIAHDAANVVGAILRASLTNTPNLTGLVALHSQEGSRMDFRKMLLELLKLDGDADEAAITAAIAAWNEKPEAATVALQSALKPIALAVGVAETADAAAVLAGVQALRSGGDDRVVSLQSQVGTLTASLEAAVTEQKRDKATAFVDAAIAAGRMGVKPERAEYISMHMSDPARAARLINAMPVLAPGATALTVVPAEGTPENPALLAQKATAYQTKQAAAGVTISFGAAVRAVNEGKAA